VSDFLQGILNPGPQPGEAESYVTGLLYELSGAVRSGDKTHQAAVRAELRRVGYKPDGAERAIDKTQTEKRG
jgi:hypothetical protein